MVYPVSFQNINTGELTIEGGECNKIEIVIIEVIY